MRKRILSYFLALILLTGCSSLPTIFGTSSKSLAKQEQKIELVDSSLSKINKQKLEDIAILAKGTDYALTKVTNPPRAVIVAKDVNQRVISEAGYSPSIVKFNEMQKMIDNLLLTNQNGMQELWKRDKAIESLINSEKTILATKEKELGKLNDLARKAASQADTTQNELTKYQSYWGLGGVFFGIKSFATHVFWYGLVGTIIFIILRVASYANPIAAAIFGIFQSIGASLIHVIEILIPQSIATLNDAKDTVNKVADTINDTIRK